MDVDIRKIIEEKDKKIEELQTKIKELERKLRYYEIKDIYQGLLPEDDLRRLLDLPPEQMIIELGKYLKERAEKSIVSTEKASESKEEIKKALEEIKTVETKLGGVKAKVGIDLNFTQRFDFEGSEVAFLGEDLMEKLGISGEEYILVQKNGGVVLRALPYSKSGFIVVPTWVREKIGAKVNDLVEVMKK